MRHRLAPFVPLTIFRSRDRWQDRPGTRPYSPCGLAYQGLRYESQNGVRGRLVADTGFSRGDRVLYEEPFAYSLSAVEGAHASHCHNSLQTTHVGRLQRCSGCKFAHYSSVGEQRRAWPRHRLECARIARAIRHGHTPSSLVLLVGRILDCMVVPPDTNTRGTWDDVQSLDLRYGELADDQMTFLSQVAYCVRDYMGAGPGETGIHIHPPPQPGMVSRAPDAGKDPTRRTMRAMDASQKQSADGEDGMGSHGADVSMRTVMELLIRVQLNAFTLVDDDLRPVGTGLYLLAAHLRHSCEASCVVSFSGVNLQVRQLEEISVQALQCMLYCFASTSGHGQVFLMMQGVLCVGVCIPLVSPLASLCVHTNGRCLQPATLRLESC